MKKRLLAMLLAAAVCASLTACGGNNDDVSESTDSSTSSESSDGTFTASGETLNVGVQSSIISIPTVYAEEQGYFDELGLDVNLIVFQPVHQKRGVGCGTTRYCIQRSSFCLFDGVWFV